MSSYQEIGYVVPEPDTELIDWLRENPEFIEVAKAYGWWAETIAQLESER